MKIQTIKPDVPTVEEIKRGLYRRLGYTDASKVPEDIFSQLQQTLELIIPLVQPACVFRITSVEETSKDKIEGKDIRIESQRWARLADLMESPKIILAYALTLGEKLDRRIASLQKQSLSKGYILDAAGSETIELIADSVEDEIWKMPDLNDYQRTARFSPGYCDWALGSQEEIFSFLEPERIGIDHTSGWSMLPSKSITAAILGAGKIQYRTPCILCDQRSCPHRREYT